MKTCDNCRYFDVCTDSASRGSICGYFSEPKKKIKVIDPITTDFSDESSTKKLYSLYIYTKDGIKHFFKSKVVKVKIYSIGGITILHVETKDKAHFDFNYSEIKWTEMNEEVSENGSNL